MRPQFTVIAAIYNVAPYIGEYLASLDRQTYGIANLEVVLVDDGSTDGSGALAERWARTSPARVRILHQENAGQGAARNAGIEIATGEWVTFADPDDVLADTYFAEVAAFLAAQSQTPDLLATRQLTFTDDHTQHVNRHPLRANFKSKNQLVDLSRFPDRIQLSGCSAFFPLDPIKAEGTRFDPRIRPTFEDAHLIGTHLLARDAPLVGFIQSAEYYYRKRVDGSSSVQSSWSKNDKYINVPRHGYLDLLLRAVKRHGTAPLWLQNTVLYDLLWYFRTDTRLASPTGSVPPDVLDEFHALCSEIFAHIDVETILGFRIVPTGHWLRVAMVAGYKDLQMRPEYVRLDSLDQAQRLVRGRYTFSGPQPDEQFFWRGRAIEPVHQKVRAVELLGRAVVYERIVWLPADGTLRVSLDGRPVPLSTKGTVDLPYQLTAARLAQDLRARQRPAQEARGSWASGLAHLLRGPKRMLGAICSFLAGWFDSATWSARVTKRIAATGWAADRFADAWVLMDREEQAKDNAEHLYRYLLRKRPEVNAWFVLRRGSDDWNRLKNEGFKMLAHGSLSWRVAMLTAAHMISSHVNAPITNPLPARLYGQPKFRFTFLQHGVTKDDLSRWLNNKRIHLIATVTEAEQKSFTADGTPYSFTDREVKKIGFPRHDRLLKLSREMESAAVDQILIMPTWRRSLTEALPEDMGIAEREEVFRQSDYARHWLGLLSSPALAEIARTSGSRLVLLPHPHPGMADLLRAAGLPGHIEVLDWKAIDVQEVLARSRMLVTDYTSVAFDVALMGKPVAYYQFDRQEFFSSGHLFRRGYFDYDRDGFGPVAQSEEELLVALERLAANGYTPSPEIAERIEATFGQRSGDACYRVYKAIRELDRPVSARPIDGGAARLPMAGQSAERGLSDMQEYEEALADGLLSADGMAGDLVSRQVLESDGLLEEDSLAVTSAGAASAGASQ
jgi:glycosyltransferase involved in cell wall biosynthesis/CDP-glycerol glycerophosphotransferase (TagB/SpsB family)